MQLQFADTEFELRVREQLGVFDRPLTEDDALCVTELDLGCFEFSHADLPCLMRFSNLRELYIEIGCIGGELWRAFPHLQVLDLVYWGGAVDFGWFAHLQDLRSLCVSGGTISDIDYLHLESLFPLSDLHTLVLHEFGSVDLIPLSSMPQIKDFALLYAKKVQGVETIAKMTQLESLRLADIEVPNLSILDALSPQLDLEICGLRVAGELDLSKLTRFPTRDVCEIEVPSKEYPGYWVEIELK